MPTITDFREVVVEDYEYYHRNGLLYVVCGCAWELRSGKQYRLWGDELYGRPGPPWAHGPDVLFICYNATAEISSRLSLHHPLPEKILDLNIEHRQMVNGILDKDYPRDLLAALRYYGLSGIEAIEKEEMRDLILTGGPFDSNQRRQILEYCWSDVAATRQLLEGMLAGGYPPSPSKRLPHDLDRALFRGRYTIPAALAMCAGIPIDEESWQLLLEHREEIRREVASGSPVYKGTVFKMDRFAEWLRIQGLLDRWPRTAKNRLSAEKDTFKDFSHIPEVEHLRQVKGVVDQLRKPSFEVINGRTYFSILPFKAESSRNSTVGCIFQSPVWLRGLIQPRPGAGLVYCDYEQQEFAIAAVLSGDSKMVQAYKDGDPYTSFAVALGLIPPGGSKATHPAERNSAKTLLLALLYGMSAQTLANRLGISETRARDLIAALERLYPRACTWLESRVYEARFRKSIETLYKWKLNVTRKTNPRTIRNFQVQATGAEIMRLASIFLHESGIKCLCPVHDALLCESSERDLDAIAAEVKRQMIYAGQYLLSGFKLRVEAKLLRYPERLIDPRGEQMWNHVRNITERLVSSISVGGWVGGSLANGDTYKKEEEEIQEEQEIQINTSVGAL